MCMAMRPVDHVMSGSNLLCMLYAIALRNVMGGATMVIKPGQQNGQAAPAVSEDSVSG